MKKFVLASVNVILATILGISIFFASVTVSEPVYDPWADINDDGFIELTDFFILSQYFGATGTPKTKAALEYDSGWLNISDKQGQYFNITHNLNTTGLIVQIWGRAETQGPFHKRLLELSGFAPGWHKTYGTDLEESVKAAIQTSDQGYILAGMIYDDMGMGDTDVFVVKTDAEGNMQWNQTFGSPELYADDGAYSVVQASDGGFIIGGWLSSSSISSTDFWLIKTDVNGNMEWNKTYGGTGEEKAYSIISTVDGGYALLGTNSPYGTSHRDVWLVKTDQNGDMQWNKTYNIAEYDSGRAVVQTVDGGFAIAGGTSSGADSNFLLIKTNASGETEWNQTYGGLGGESAYSLVQTGDGGYALAGVYTPSGSFKPDMWLVKTNSSGNMEWNNTLGGTGRDVVYSLIQTEDGGFAAAGYTDSIGHGSFDGWLIKMDSNGSFQWEIAHGGESSDSIQSVIQLPSDEGYVLAGSTNSFGPDDFWLLKADALGLVDESYQEVYDIGLALTSLTDNTLTFYRGASDPYWNYMYVRIWKTKETP